MVRVLQLGPLRAQEYHFWEFIETIWGDRRVGAGDRQ